MQAETVTDASAESPRQARSVTANFAWMTGGTLGNRFAKFVLFYLLARYMGAGAFGELTYAYAAVVLASAVADFGVSLAAPPRIALARAVDQQRRVCGGYFAWKLVLGALVVLGWLGWAGMQGAGRVRLLLLLFTPCVVLNELTLEWLFRGRGELRPVGIAKLAAGGVLVGLGLLLGASEASRHLVPLAFVTAGVVLVSLQAAAASRWGIWRGLQLSIHAVQGGLGRVSRYGVSMIVNRAYSHSALLLVAWVLGMQAAGRFKLLHMPFILVLACGKWMADSVVARFARAMQRGGSESRAVLLRCGRRLLLLSVAAACAMASVGPWALHRFFPDYGSFWGVGAALGAVLPVATLTLFLRELLPALGKPDTYLAVTCTMVAVQVCVIVVAAAGLGLLAVPLAYGAAELAALAILVPAYAAALRRRGGAPETSG
ncbi:MAG: oligosaccharide flippase family protein [Candidatus Brocadiia bacterium]